MQHHPVPAHLRSAPVDEGDERINRATPFPVLPRSPPADSQPPSYRLAIDSKLSGDTPGAFAPLPPRRDLPYQFLWKCTTHDVTRASRLSTSGAQLQHLRC